MNNTTLRLVLLGFVASVGSLLLSACGTDSEGTIQVYTGRHYDLEAAFEAFESEFGIDIEFLEGSDAELRERLQAEGDDSSADIYMTVDAGNLATAAEQGLFASLDSPVLDAAIPAELRDPDGSWYALSARVRTIVYSTERLAPDDIPTTYEELAEPQWKDRVCLRTSSNTYTQSLVASLIASRGYDATLEVANGWADNAHIMAKDGILLDSIRDGRCDVGIANHYYLARKLAEDPDYPVGLVWANQNDRGVHVNLSGAGVLANADDPELAQQLLEWLATDGQNLFVDGNNEYPVNPDVAPETLIATEFGVTFEGDRTNASEWGLLNAEAVRLLDEAGYE